MADRLEDVDRCRGAGGIADEMHPSSDFRRRDRPLQRTAAGHVDNRLGAAPARELEYPFRLIVIGCDQNIGSAELAELIRMRGMPRRGDDPGAGGLRELDGSG